MIDVTTKSTSTTVTEGRRGSLMKKFGFAGFMFFFAKGLLWIIVPAVIAWIGVK